MDKNKELLQRFVNAKSKFFDLRDGDEKTVKYLSVESVITHFSGKPIDSIRFHFEVDGKEMLWDRTSRELAQQMSVFSSGDVLRIKVEGQKNKAKYFITKLN